MTAQAHAPKLPSPYQLVQLGGVDSTNLEARRRAEGGAPDRSVIWASHQTVGRGRRGREWSSPEGNLYFSILLRPDYSLGVAMQLGFVMASAIAGAVEDVLPGGASVQTKWPNDVMVGGKKISGILLESENSIDGSSLDWLIIGAGINVEVHPDIIDSELSATSLASKGANVPVTSLLSAIISRFDAGLAEWLQLGFAPARKAWLDRAAGLGQSVSVRLPNETIHGTFSRLDESGALVLATDGEQGEQKDRIITAGDVFLSPSVDEMAKDEMS